MQKSRIDQSFYVLVYALTLLAVVITLYPFLYVVSVSLSSVEAIDKKLVTLFPVDFSLSGYRMVLQYPDLWRAYYNTIWYTVVGTVFNIVATCLAAYPLSRKRFFLRRKLNFYIAFTMYFSGGLIPLYMVITELGLYNTRWAMVLPVLVSTFNVMILRSAFENIPNEIFESASMDGAREFTLLFRLAIPLTKPTLAVLTLYYAVAHWNDFFNALLYLGKQELQPLQIFLRRVLIMASPEVLQKMGGETAATSLAVSTLQVRYVAIVVSILPIITIYPFIQKYFVKGITLGAVKG
ncbi:carbohydrate ABC transporter permease [Paenibacillus mucilaginosus]|uniref:Binding-protein-dependent transport systems inner membrane component n=2 Tax=Paenibacillus mucilaginosus TaxID=61624 RepID=H6NEF7_9BACL|nr:carbohydrate ABC transporter permease [Paenibacillus mucilaginosus]AEI42315.1 binding-protein-dependent transport systems inner membrane component [Paenibacillus mucilaginosus KNP414]AFC28100.1 binding-protein-dependent transport systems inner membrane component [Paenibacillus mucilaginosus 3016]MCG7214273.1 carbohydrate ABC transporter permease [Paenibacillus mucilaginosus]WDM28782.1 carbohydrate ABC transporter permease [Paenibacillus mucilaginosus]WFA16948.1 carbohydrate ABC transporter 